MRIDLCVMTIDQYGSALHATMTDVERAVADAREIHEKEQKPVFLRVSYSNDETWHEHNIELISSTGELRFGADSAKLGEILEGLISLLEK